MCNCLATFLTNFNSQRALVDIYTGIAADDGDGFSGGGDPIEQGGPRLAARGHQGGLPDALQVDFCLALLKQP